MDKPKGKSYEKLGFSEEEATEIVEALNLLLANYAISYQKMRNFHWNVTGGDFFEVHEKLEEEYNAASEAIDSVAERIRIMGFRPFSNYSEFLKHAEIEEPADGLSGEEMMQEVINDIEMLLSFMVDTADLAVSHGDLGTETMMRSMIVELEKKHWMYTSLLS